MTNLLISSLPQRGQALPEKQTNSLYVSPNQVLVGEGFYVSCNIKAYASRSLSI